MRRRVVASLPAAEAGRELKLGPGGLRDIEFAVQLLQLVHGRADESLRDAGHAAGAGQRSPQAATSAGLTPPRWRRPTGSCAASSTWSSSASCGARTCCPRTRRILREIGRALIADADRSAPRRWRRSGDPAAALAAQWRLHASQARQLHEKLFYRPLLDAVARLPGEATRLTPEAARDRLAGARLRRPSRGTAAHRVADCWHVAEGGDAAHAAARAARLAGGRARA